jgi:DNA polymerase-3 subunit delta
MDLTTLAAVIKTRELPCRIWIFAGREEFLKERTVEDMATALVPPEDRAENVKRLDCDLISVNDVFQGLDTFSFNPSPRLYLLFGPEQFGVPEKKQLMARLAENTLPPDVYLIFLTQDGRFANDLEKAVKDRGAKVDFWPPFENQIPQWISRSALDLGCPIIPKAAEALWEKIGSDLRILFQELTKLVIQGKKQGKITEELVEQSVRFQRQDTVFDVLEKIGTRNAGEALSILETLLQMGEAPLLIFTMITKTLRDFRLLHALAFDRPDVVQPVVRHLAEVAKQQGKSDFRANQERKRLTSLIQEQVSAWPELFVEQLRLDNPMQIKNLSLAVHFSRQELEQFWPRLLETDRRLKSSLPNQKLPLQEMIIELIARKGSSKNATS